MAELDLIPAAYRRRLYLLRSLRVFALLYLVLALLLAGGRMALSRGIDERSAEISAAKRASAEAAQQRSQLTELRRQQQVYRRYLGALEGLRGGAVARDMFPLVDRALNPGVWFSEWRFIRAGEEVRGEQSQAQLDTPSVYFVMLPADGQSEPPRAWQVHTHMEFRAHARDHSAMADFMRSLGEQSRIDSVRLLSSRSRRDGDGEMIDFELAVVVAPGPESDRRSLR